MPFVGFADAWNEAVVRIPDALARFGAAGGRQPLVASPHARCILLKWLPGESTETHQHPHALEVFLVIEGRLMASIETAGKIVETRAEGGTLMLALPGERHRFEVLGLEPVVLLAVVAPNEDRPDETIP